MLSGSELTMLLHELNLDYFSNPMKKLPHSFYATMNSFAILKCIEIIVHPHVQSF